MILKMCLLLCVIVLVWNPSIWKAETGGSGVSGYPELPGQTLFQEASRQCIHLPRSCRATDTNHTTEGLAWHRAGPKGSQLGRTCIQITAWPRSLKASEKEPKAVRRGQTCRGNVSIISLPCEGLPTAYQLVHMSIGLLSSCLSGS